MRSKSAPKAGEPAAPRAGEATLDAGDYEARRAAFIEAEVERALAMWKGLLPPDVLEAFRERTVLFLTTDPGMIRAVDAAVPREPEDRSKVKPGGGREP